MSDKIPTIYASIGRRDDIRPSTRSAVGAILTVRDERERLDRIENPATYIAQLEQAVREALSSQFLADSLREWAETNLLFENAKIEVHKLADIISPKSL